MLQKSRKTKAEKMLYVLMALFVSFIATDLGLATTAPLGKRKYVMPEKEYIPTKINGLYDKSAKKTVYMQDPGDAVVIEALPKRVASKPKEKESTVKYVPQKLKFKQVSIRGHLNEPRVKFDQNTLPVGRSDETIDYDFIDKAFEDGRKL